MPNLVGPSKLFELEVILCPAETPDRAVKIVVWVELTGRRARVVDVSGDLSTMEACLTALDFVGVALAAEGFYPVVVDWGMER